MNNCKLNYSKKVVIVLNKIIENLDIHAKGIWVPIVWAVLLLIMVLFMPKEKMNGLQIYCTYGVISAITWIANSVFAIYLDWVDFGRGESTGIGELLTYALIPSSLAIWFLNKLHRDKRMKRTLLFALLSLFIEWTCHISGFMEYKGWNLLYSIPVYIIIYYFFLPFHYRLIKDIKVS